MSGLVRGSDCSRIVLSGRNCSLVMDRPYIVGILNVTPDSFSDGGRFLRPQQAIEQGLRMAAEGADLIDIGGESTRPGAFQVFEQEELDRLSRLSRSSAAKSVCPCPLTPRKVLSPGKLYLPAQTLSMMSVD